MSVGKAALELASDRKAGGTGLAARAEARAAIQVVDAKANVAKRMASKAMTQYDAAYFATAAAASNPPRLEDLLNTPSKEILAQECEIRDLPVKRSGDDTAYPRQATELVQFLVQRLRDFHDGSNNIPKLTSFGAGKRKEAHELEQQQRRRRRYYRELC